MRASFERLLIRPLAWYLRHLTFDAMRWRLQILAIQWSASLRGALPRCRVRTRYGFDMEVDGNSQVGRILYATGQYENEIASILARTLSDGDTFVDGGAHIGFFTVFASRCVGPTGRVIAFEPAGQTRERLLSNVSLNGCRNVSVRSEALGASPGESVLSHLAEGETGQMTMRPVSSFAGRETVRVMALDDEAAKLGRVRLIKLDLEGNELAALSGMEGLLKAQQPDVVVEVTDDFLRASGGSGSAMYRLMTDLGYQPFIIHYDRLEHVSTEERWHAQLHQQFNALFTRRRLPE